MAGANFVDYAVIALYALLMVRVGFFVLQLFPSASTLFGLSLFVSSACGFPVTWTILGAGALIVFYCVLGGLWAVVVSDFLQASILMPFCLVLGILSLARVGGVTGLIHSLPPEMKTLHVSGEF